jgi:hypothetical protein
VTKAIGINSSRAEPLKVMPFNLRTGRSRTGRRTPADGSWVNQPVVQVENVSGKAIEYLVIEVSLPDAESSRDQSPVMLAYGQAPGQRLLSKPAESLRPGSKVNLIVGLHACGEVKSRLLASGKQPPPGSRAAAKINGVVFTDGTAWFDGLLHVADPDNPLRWNVIETSPRRASLLDAPFFSLATASYRAASAPAPRREQCWKRMGTEWVECCGLMRASAILIQMWGGIYEPLLMSSECGNGGYCEWIKQVGCTSDPQGEVPPED